MLIESRRIDNNKRSDAPPRSIHINQSNNQSEHQSKAFQAFIILLLAVVYAVSGQFGLYLQGETQGVTTLWPPTGIAAFFIYKFGYRVWPGIILGLFFVAYVIGDPVHYSPFIVLILGFASVLEAFGIVFLLNRYDFSPALYRMKDFVLFFTVPFLVIPLLNALFGSGVFVFNHYIAKSDWLNAFLGWWLGNSMGLLTVFPLLLIWSHYPIKYYRVRIKKVIELFLIASITIYAYTIYDVFNGNSPAHHFVSFILVIFCSIRYLHQGASLIAFVLAISVSVHQRDFNNNPFALSAAIEQEIFIALIYITGFYIATVLKAQLETKRQYFREKIYAETILKSIYDSVIVTDLFGKILFTNPGATSLLGASETRFLNLKLSDVFSIRDELTQEDLTLKLIETIKAENFQFPHKSLLLQTKSNTYNVEIFLSAIKVDNGISPSYNLKKSVNLNGCALTIHNVSQSHKLKKELQFQASHDHLTNLYNRRDFENKLNTTIKELKFNKLIDQNDQHVLLFIDLDHFKVVNDTSGHIAGDQVLKTASKILQSSLRKEDILARIGGDEFAILLKNCTLAKGKDIANKLRLSIADAVFSWHENKFSLSTSIGLTIINQSTSNEEEVMKQADIACYEAKEAGKNNVFVYHNTENTQRETDILWLSRIVKAIDNKQFELYVQPIVFCQSLENSHYEVLLRLRLENDELVSPAQFIPAAEKYGAMPKIDKWVFNQSIQWLKEKEKVSLSVNLSGNSLSNNAFCNYLKSEIAMTNLQPGKLCIEITETAAIKNFEMAKYFIDCSKEYGVRFALDDFGSGLSSFAYLKNFPVDYLKIDGSFVKEMANNPIDNAMVKSIHEVGKVMGIETVAEFVENDEIIESCRLLGIDYLQGYAIAKPFPISEI